MSSRLSPSETSKVCESPSLSMKVTLRSSPGLGGSRWPCSREFEEEKGRVEGRERVDVRRRLDGEDSGVIDRKGDEVEAEGRTARCINLAADLEAAIDIVTGVRWWMNRQRKKSWWFGRGIGMTVREREKWSAAL